MPPRRVHVTGASGAGRTTLGRALASAWEVPHADTDDYYWLPTTPPYTTAREPAARLQLMREMFLGRDAWVLSGSVVSWGGPLLGCFDLVVFLTLDPHVRIDRLRARERRRYGARIEPGGDLEQAHRDFMDWTRRYDDPEFTGRSRTVHERWLATLPCPVLRLDGARAVEELVAEIEAVESPKAR